MVFERTKASRKAAVFFDSLPESFFLKSSAKIGIILLDSRKRAGIHFTLSELYNTVEVKNYAE